MMNRGEELRAKYIAKQGREKIASYKKIIHDYIYYALDILEKYIDEGENPIVTIKIVNEDNKVITNPDMIPAHFQDVVFHMLLAEETDKYSLEVCFRMDQDNIDGNTVQIPTLTFTFK